MLEYIKEIIAKADMIAVSLTMFVVVLACTKNWMVANIQLRPSFYMMIVLGISQALLNTYLASVNEGQEVLMLMNVPSVWVALMGIKGLRKLNNGGLRQAKSSD